MSLFLRQEKVSSSIQQVVQVVKDLECQDHLYSIIQLLEINLHLWMILVHWPADTLVVILPSLQHLRPKITEVEVASNLESKAMFPRVKMAMKNINSIMIQMEIHRITALKAELMK